jgi:hypothetical protein
LVRRKPGIRGVSLEGPGHAALKKGHYVTAVEDRTGRQLPVLIKVFLLLVGEIRRYGAKGAKSSRETHISDQSSEGRGVGQEKAPYCYGALWSGLIVVLG